MPVRDRIVELRRVPAGDLRANPRNWRRHPASQAKALASVLDQVGYAGALVARETPQGLELIDGHLRAETTPDQEVPVLVLDVDQAEADVILATLDPLSTMAEVDPIQLRDLLGDVDIPDSDLAAVLKAWLPDEVRTGNTDPDQVPVIPAKPKTRPGDVWVLGQHRLICGDSKDPVVLETLVDGRKADLVWTDPPYNVDYMGGTTDHLTIDNDALTTGHFEELLETAFRNAWKVTRGGGPIYVCHADGGPSGLIFRQAIGKAGWDLKQVLIWVKSSLVLSRQDYHWQHEPILYGWKPGAAHLWFGGFIPTTVIDEEIPPAKMSKAALVEIVEQLMETTTVMREDKPHRNAEHPTVKPVGLVERALRNSSRTGARVLDPFAGAGTVLIAAERLNRRGLAVEIDPGYCDVTVKRWEAFTGQKAERA
jgi:DNA modification methylase